MNSKRNLLASCFIFYNIFVGVFAQDARIHVEKITYRTYGFSDPNPVVKINDENRHKIYPYYRFDGFENKGISKEWDVIILENDYIKVLVAPEIGGKVLGAIEKSTGHEFLYYNKVVKFRDISSRGAWTSGGIEFNFGSIGHTPMVSTPVDYFIRNNENGSVSCFVGAADLSSRTKWTVEIRLAKDKAYFETIGSWHNASDLETSLYHWSNAAAEVSNDLQFFYPGTHHVFHDGLKYSYPINEKGIDISHYGNINFGGDKSQHVIGTYTDVFGGYYENKDFGFVHWSDYTEKPGKKKFMWSASRQGEIWKDLLTDADLGNKQYMEFQSGFMFNQASPGSEKSPFNHLPLLPNVTESFIEAWFPVVNTEGISTANKIGTIHVLERNGLLVFNFCPVQKISDDLKITIGGKIVYSKSIDLKPLQTFKDSITLKGDHDFKITVGDDLISYSLNDEKRKVLKRPLKTPDFNWESAFGYYTSGEEWSYQRFYSKAVTNFEKCLSIDPYFVPALEDLAELYYRRMDYDKATDYSLKALAIDTYTPKANYIFGLSMLRANDFYNALDAFGIASKDMKYRSLSYLKIAQLYIEKQDFKKAVLFAEKSLKFNADSETALHILLMGNRLIGKGEITTSLVDELLSKNPLNHLAHIEKVFSSGDTQAIASLSERIKNEYASETWLEMAIVYYNLGRLDEALILLENAPESVMNNLWLSAFHREKGNIKDADTMMQKVSHASPELVFPYRPETYDLLQRIIPENENWKLKYYMALIAWSKNNTIEATSLFNALESIPNDAPYYLTKANFFSNDKNYNPLDDLLKAKTITPNDWRVSRALVAYYRRNNDTSKALIESGNAVRGHKTNFLVAYDYARSLFENGDFKKCLKVLDDISILPAEGARSVRTTYRQTCLMLSIQYYQKKKYKTAMDYVAKARLYPEELGTGRPYVVDERIEDYIEALCLLKTGMPQNAEKALNKIEDFTLLYNKTNNSSDYVSMLSFDYIYMLTLKHRGRVEEINSFLSNWKERSDNSLSYQWAV
ncbi:MAG: hypothetical protein DRJ07_02625, partial [Bacteroidetes bacterium]